MPLREVWDHVACLLDDLVRGAVQAEADGWDGVMVPVNPTLLPDPWVTLALMARETSHLKLGTGVTNPAPSMAPVLAASATTVQQVSAGRVVLGIGRGDSAGALLGMGPITVTNFDRYVSRVQSFLRGEQVPFDVDFDGGGLFPPVATLELEENPQAAMLSLFLKGGPKVPLDVFATGPKVIKIGAKVADRITFAVGGEPARVEWAITTAREAIEDAGRDCSEVSLGAWLPIFVHEDRAFARRQVTGQVASMARFSSMQGKVTNPIREADREIYQGLHDKYSYKGHFTAESAQSKVLTPEFIDRFAIIGPAKECVERLEFLVSLGLDRIALISPMLGVSTGAWMADEAGAAKSAHVDGSLYARRALVEEVLPDLRTRTM